MRHTIEDLLRQHNINLNSTQAGQHNTICPQCTHERKLAHQKQKKLSVKIDSSGVCWNCAHCGWSGPPKGSRHNGHDKFRATHDYKDANGQYLYTKVCYPKGHDPKCHLARRNGKGWIWNTGKLARVLYRLPEVLAAVAEGKTIAVAEGESDVDALWAAGVPATCSRDGAAMASQKPKWLKADSEQLRNAKEVVVLGDHDDAGYAHQQVTVQLTAAVGPRVRVLRLADHWPNCPQGGDVRDWLEANHTSEELLALMENAPEYQQQQADTEQADTEQADSKAKAQDDGLTPEQAAEIARLAALPAIQYDQARAAAAVKLGIRVGTLDELVAKNRPYVADDTAQGTALNIAVTEPWPEPVNGDELVAEIEQNIKKHVVLTDDQALACALWTVHTHAHSISEHSPRLNIASPAPECGKSTLLKTISRIVAKPLVVENISTAALFRVVEMVVPTMLIDEVDTFLKDNDEMRGLLNAGHERNGQVIRVSGENLEPRTFKVGCPTVLAGIGELPPTLESRSITIALRRRLRKETISRLRSNRMQHLDVLGRKAARWVADKQIALGAADPALPEELNDRAQDNWRQLIAIADLCSAALGERARAAAVAITAENVDEDNSASTMVLTDVAAIFQNRGTAALASADIVTALIYLDDRPWSRWRRGEPLTQNSLARLLKPFHIRPTQVKALNRKGYEAAPIIDAKARYVDRAGADAPDTPPAGASAQGTLLPDD